MGYCNSEWVAPFVRGKTIDSIKQEEVDGYVRLCFTDGTSLRLFVKVRQPATPKHELIVTPYAADGEVVQSMDIMKAAAK